MKIWRRVQIHRREGGFGIPNAIQINFHFRSCFQKNAKVQPTTRDEGQVTMLMVTAAATVLTTVTFRLPFPHICPLL